MQFNRYRKGKMTRLFGIKCRSIILSTVLCTCGLLALVGVFSCLFSDERLISLYKNGKYQIVEDEVFVFHEQMPAGHDKGDIIKVGDERFEIDSFVFTNAYNRTIAHGGVLTDGAYVRIYHYEGKILRIDIREEKGHPIEE